MARVVAHGCRAFVLLAATFALSEANGEDGLPDAKHLQEMLAQMPREETLRMKKELEDMVGQGGGAGEPAADRPPPVELSLDTARALTEALVAALRSKKAQKAIEKALPSSGEEGLSTPDRRQALAPTFEKVARPVLKRYDFSGSFQDALDSAKAAMQRTRDMALAAAFEELGEVVTGQRSPLREGRVAELDKLAREFLAMSDADRRAALAEAEQAFGRLGSTAHPASEQYLKAMSGVLASGQDAFIEDRMVQLAQQLQDNSDELGEEGVQAHRAQLNVLSQFLAPDGHARLKARLTGGSGSGKAQGKPPPSRRKRRKAKNDEI